MEIENLVQYVVTPCVGVWIETPVPDFPNFFLLSHPAWVCGLKLYLHPSYLRKRASHPAWVCGLKQQLRRESYLCQKSHPAWVCGLKPFCRTVVVALYKVTPCVGVWIETIDGLTEEWIKKSHPAWVCGLKQLPIDYFFDRDGHTLRGCVD